MDFLTLKMAKLKNTNEYVDVIGIVNEINNSQIKLKTGENKNKTSLYIIDENKESLEITVWGDMIIQKGIQKREIVGF